MFVLAESSSGYTIKFSIYTGKIESHSEHGLSYDVVMNLIHTSSLGTGYHIYMENFYSSPKLFMDLVKMKFGACCTYSENRKGCPTGRANAFTRKKQKRICEMEGPSRFCKMDGYT